MKRLAITLCLLGVISTSAFAQVCMPSDYPQACFSLCRLLNGYLHVVRWDYCDGFPFVPPSEVADWAAFGCDSDAYAFHAGAECGYALNWINRWDFADACHIAPELCIRETAMCMMAHPYWDGCFCGHPGDEC